MQFSEFGLNPALLENILRMGYSAATPIQDEVIPLALASKDVSGLSKTGTGKTAAFLIPSIHRLLEMDNDRIILCLAPTRELAIQIEQEAKRLSQDLNLGTVSVVGGMSSADQIDALRKGARIVIGTPGRLIDLFKERALDLSKVGILVFDEADRMFDMGFIRDMQYIMDKIPNTRQILLFSATLNFTVLHMIYEYGSAPVEVNVSLDQVTADGIEQVLYHVSNEEKPKALIAVCRKYAGDESSIIVFSNYKERVPEIAAYLKANGITAQGLSSLMRQEKRNKIIQGFRTGQFRALVATDVASRGLDIDNISLVVNCHLPEDAATYVHRIGRTARAGKSGIAVAIASSEDGYNQMRVEEFLGKKIPVEWFSDEDMKFELVHPQYVEREDDEEGGENRERRPRRTERGATSSERPARREPQRGRPPRAARPAQAEHSDEAPTTETRTQRHERPERSERHERTERRDSRDSHREKRAPFKAPSDTPSPLTGNPVIYDTRTGGAKNRSPDEIKALLKAARPKGKRVSTGQDSPLFKKIRTRVSALFAPKK